MTKQEIRMELFLGRALSEILEFTDGQDCVIFKSDRFFIDDEVCYIPDVSLNDLPIYKTMLDRDEINRITAACYTGTDFWTEAGGDAILAERLFWYVDWQHPCSAIDEVDDSDECADYAISAGRARALLRRISEWMAGNLGVDSAIGNLFFIGATPDEVVALGFDPKNVEMLYSTYEEDVPWI